MQLSYIISYTLSISLMFHILCITCACVLYICPHLPLTRCSASAAFIKKWIIHDCACFEKNRYSNERFELFLNWLLPVIFTRYALLRSRSDTVHRTDTAIALRWGKKFSKSVKNWPCYDSLIESRWWLQKSLKKFPFADLFTVRWEIYCTRWGAFRYTTCFMAPWVNIHLIDRWA